MRAPDPLFDDPRLAVLYDHLDGERDDLEVYVGIVAELGARRVVDLGCGTGSLALRLAEAGLDVTGVDPASASLDVARGKPGADSVAWVHGDATAIAPAVAPGSADLVVMTGNVAQVFVDDADWEQTLAGVRAGLRPGGALVFETRRPQARAWETWDVAPTDVPLPGGGLVTVDRTVTAVALPLVTFEWTCTVDGGHPITSTSTLRFRDQDEIEADLHAHGFVVEDVREAPDRPGLELVFVAIAAESIESR